VTTAVHPWLALWTGATSPAAAIVSFVAVDLGELSLARDASAITMSFDVASDSPRHGDMSISLPEV
jgi:hypothetical protein